MNFIVNVALEIININLKITFEILNVDLEISIWKTNTFNVDVDVQNRELFCTERD